MPRSLTLALLALSAALATAADPPRYESELIFPLHPKHNHAPAIVECPNGDLLVSWYRGSGERKADDVAVHGARLPNGAAHWSDSFLMIDHPEFPDCNTAMMIDADQRLWLFRPVILANTWESCITHYTISSDYQGNRAPTWSTSGVILLKPDDFQEPAEKHLQQELARLPEPHPEWLTKEVATIEKRLGDKLYQRLGWQPRCKPTVLPSGRILLPLYSDTYSFSLMAISDDGGRHWRASKPLLGYGAIQPSVLRRDDGTLVAYMRENGPNERIRVCDSKDDGETWGPVYLSSLPNPGSGLDGVRLKNGHWLLVYNDTIDGRHSLAVSWSDDEGRTWKRTRHLEKHEIGQYHYPAVIQARDGTIHVVYSFFVEGGKSMKHAAFSEAWLTNDASFAN